MRNCVWFATVPCLVTAAFSSAQENPSPHFEVASVKPVADGRLGSFSGGPGSSDPERITFESTNLETLIQNAYGVLPDQISGPDWLRRELFTVTAKLPPGTTIGQFRQMIVNLLAERFGLVVHHASKRVSGYNLTVIPGGPKLGSAVETSERVPPFSGKRGEDGLMHYVFRRESMPTLASQLSMVLATGQPFARGGRPERAWVVDQTDIVGRFDFRLDFPAPFIPGLSSASDARVDPDDVPRLVTDALAKQLGLKLTATKIDLDMVIVDHVDRMPTPN